MDKQVFSKLTVALLLMLFVFALGNIVFNLENLYIGVEEVPEFIASGSASQSVATGSTTADALRWVWFGFLIFSGIMIIVAAASFTTSKDKKKWRKLLHQMLAALMVCLCLFAFGFFYEDIESSVMGGGDTNILPDSGSGNISSADGTTPPASPDTMKTFVTLGIFAVVFLFWVVLFIGIAHISKLRSTKLDYSDIERDTIEVAHTIQRTIDAIAGGSDTRATVIRCYTDMCKVMSKYGVKEEEYLTPREFQKLATANLPIPEEQMRSLVDIFEEARYSQHNLGTEDGQRAVKALEAVKERLLAFRPEAAQAKIGEAK
ncbi:MAG: DUF4129 domain-containing protein [Thermoplasmata archaeon]|nr:DUF4129 domain-containing protein [Thermoplasmata archaeon]